MPKSPPVRAIDAAVLFVRLLCALFVLQSVVARAGRSRGCILLFAGPNALPCVFCGRSAQSTPTALTTNTAWRTTRVTVEMVWMLSTTALTFTVASTATARAGAIRASVAKWRRI
jgi:hypothetical protein